VEGGEMCDDGNATSGDGCSAACAVEAGWTCAGPGRPCATRCGDGIVAGAEECDTGETNGSGGCSSSCTLVKVDAGPPAGDAAVYPMVEGDQGTSVIDSFYVERHFEELLVGTWLIGWYGGENHFSWLRISNESGGVFGRRTQLLSNPNLPANVAMPYWNCSGAGTWGITQRPATLDLNTMPGGCAREVLNFDSVWPVSTQGRAILQAKLSAGRIADGGGYEAWQSLVGYKYPDDMCNADFTSCSAPF
jgi:cysteine-rich repeat protein